MKRWVWPIALVLVPAIVTAGPRPAQRGPAAGMVRIEGGRFRPLFATKVVSVAPFAIDTLPMAAADQPRTNVSWETAAAICQARGARLPTTNEWEYLAVASETERDASAQSSFKQRVLELALRRRAPRLGQGLRNVWGVRDLHGGVFEWTDDSRHGKHAMTCGGGASQGDASDYAAFLRHSFRQTVNPKKGGSNIGFRCAMSL